MITLERTTLYTLSGLVLIVGSLFAASKALGSLLAVLYFLASTDFEVSDRSMSENLVNSWKASHLSSLLHNIGSSLILFFGGRWILKGPGILDRWIGWKDGETEIAGHANDSI